MHRFCKRNCVFVTIDSAGMLGWVFCAEFLFLGFDCNGAEYAYKGIVTCTFKVIVLTYGTLLRVHVDICGISTDKFVVLNRDRCPIRFVGICTCLISMDCDSLLVTPPLPPPPVGWIGSTLCLGRWWKVMMW